MIRRSKSIIGLGIFTAILTAGAAQAALQLEGQSGVFLNTLAYTAQKSNYEASSHWVDLGDAGNVSTFNFTTGLKKNVEVGLTRLQSDVDGVKDQNLLLAKWQFQQESKNRPAASLWAIHRNVSGSDNSLDLGVSATKVFTVASHPLVVDLGVRSTKAKSLGLFGFNKDREIKWEGSFALFATKKFAVGAEFKQQIGTRAWKDIAFRYIASNKLNIDLGIANLGPGLNNQVALAFTHSL